MPLTNESRGRIGEARRLVANGYSEIVLTGVDITSYAPGLGFLVKKLLRDVPELKRLRLWRNWASKHRGRANDGEEDRRND